VNDAPLFTGNFGSFAEYRVNACRTSLKIPPSRIPSNLREIAMNTIYIFERIAEGLLAVAATGVTVLALLV
jgi:hypothetical protein